MPAKLKICLALAASAAAAIAAVLPAATASAQPARPGRAAAAAAASASLPRITIAMTGKKIAVSGALQSGGVEIASRVSHECQGDPVLVRLDPGVTVAQFLAALPKIANDPNNLYGVGHLVFSVEAGPGHQRGPGQPGRRAVRRPGPEPVRAAAADLVQDRHGQRPGRAAQARRHRRVHRVRLPRPRRAA